VFRAQFQANLVAFIDELDSLFDAAARERVDALVIDNPSIFFANLERIADLVARHRPPAIAEGQEWGELDLSMTYGLDYLDARHHDPAERSPARGRVIW